MTGLAAFLATLIRLLLPHLLQASKDTVEDGARDRSLERRLKRKIPPGLKAVMALLLLVSLGGCFTRVVYVADDAPVRLREDIPNAKVWSLDAAGAAVKAVKTLKAGQYVVTDTGEDE